MKTTKLVREKYKKLRELAQQEHYDEMAGKPVTRNAGLCRDHAAPIRKMIVFFMEAAELGEVQGGKLTKEQLWDLCIDAAIAGYEISNDAAEDGEIGDDVGDVLKVYLERVKREMEK